MGSMPWLVSLRCTDPLRSTETLQEQQRHRCPDQGITVAHGYCSGRTHELCASHHDRRHAVFFYSQLGETFPSFQVSGYKCEDQLTFTTLAATQTPQWRSIQAPLKANNPWHFTSSVVMTCGSVPPRAILGVGFMRRGIPVWLYLNPPSFILSKTCDMFPCSTLRCYIFKLRPSIAGFQQQSPTWQEIYRLWCNAA